MTARLVMLLGAFGGNRETLTISKRNPLKYYEKPAVFHFNDLFIRRARFSDGSYTPYQAQNFTLTLPLPEEQQDELVVCPLLSVNPVFVFSSKCD